MTEQLTVDDVRAYVMGALNDADDTEVQRLLDAALDRVRRFCGWHVSPVREDTAALHGGGWGYVVLPTLKIVSIESATSDGETVDPDDTEQYTGESGVLYRKDGRWCGRVEVGYHHGYTADEAAAFWGEVLALIDRTLASIGTGASGPLTSLEVDDVTLKWSGVTDRILGGMAKNPLDESVLYQYRIIPV